MFCEFCGNQIPDNAKFCEHCGAKVDGGAPSYPPESADRAANTQPGASYSQPGASYSQPGASYTQPNSSYTQPGAAYTRPGATQERSDGFSVSARPEVRILGIPVRGKGLWIALGVIAVVVIAIVVITRLGGAKEPGGDEPPQTLEVVEATPEPTPEPAPEPEPGPNMAEIAGIYRLVRMSTEADGDLSGEIELMASMGLAATLELNPDGTGVMNAYGEYTESFTWDENGIIIDGEPGPYVYENNTITLTEGDELMVFQRTTYEELRALAEAAQAVSEPTGTMDASLAGDYYATVCLQNGEDVGVDDEYLHLEGDGTGYFNFMGTHFALDWRLDGETFYFLDETGDEFHGTYRDGVIEGEWFDGYYYVLVRDAAPSETEPFVDGSPAVRDPNEFSTTEAPTLADFQWLTYDVTQGWRPEGREPLYDLEQARGGWKCYLIDDPNGEYGSMMERLLNVYIVGTPEGADLTFDWLYVYDGSQDQGFDDDTPDSVFSGSWENGAITAIGSGSVTLTDFWYADGHEYGMGIYIWPDGVPAFIALVRP